METKYDHREVRVLYRDVRSVECTSISLLQLKYENILTNTIVMYISMHLKNMKPVHRLLLILGYYQ